MHNGGEFALNETLELIRRTRPVADEVSILGSHRVHLDVAPYGPVDVTSVYEVRAGIVTVLLANKHSYREDVAVALLDAAEQVGVAWPGAAVHVRPMEVPGCPLDRAVVLGPGGHRWFAETPELAGRTIGIFALHRSEFVEGEDGAAFFSAINNRGLGVPIAEWHRAPKPRADVRLLDDWPGGAMRRLRRPAPWSAERLMTHYVPDLPRGVRLSVCDVRGFELLLERRWDRIVGTITAPHRAATADVDIARIKAWDTWRPLFLGETVDLTTLGAATAETAPETDMLELTYSSADRGYASLPMLRPLDDCVARLSAHHAHRRQLRGLHRPYRRRRQHQVRRRSTTLAGGPQPCKPSVARTARHSRGGGPHAKASGAAGRHRTPP
ncbi:hypothetical protein AB0J72_26220 [Dactylosporangium sp. NPDC049742]|uniref:hypothetical protein n=1 Tax=Dactylosporangium sp. NPDC049742 TaxID=3154737 RepID=UPI003441F4B6